MLVIWSLLVSTHCLRFFACVGSLHVRVIACEMGSGRLQIPKDEQIFTAESWNSAFYSLKSQ